MYTEGTASRPPTAKGLADIGVQENEIGSRVVALRVLAAQADADSHHPVGPIALGAGRGPVRGQP